MCDCKCAATTKSVSVATSKSESRKREPQLNCRSCDSLRLLTVSSKNLSQSAISTLLKMSIPNSTVLRPVQQSDFESIARIYNHYIANTVVTFEVEPISADDIRQRVAKTQAASLPWLVARREDQVVGYAYAGRWHSRYAYRFSAESTVYLDTESRGLGIGSCLYKELLRILRDKGIHTVIGGIALPNEASVALHEKLGFEKAAHYAEVGFKFERRIDVGYWQKLLSHHHETRK